MNSAEMEARGFLREFEEQPEDIRQLFVYAVCQTMAHAGTLQIMGAFADPSLGVTLLYRNPDSGEVFEIVKPKMTSEEEQAMRAHIGELLQDHAQAV